MITQALESNQIVSYDQVVLTNVERLKTVKQDRFLVCCGGESFPLY